MLAKEEVTLRVDSSLRIELRLFERECDRLVTRHCSTLVPCGGERLLVECGSYQGQRVRVSLLLVEGNARASFLVQVQRAREKPCGGLHPICTGIDRSHAAQAVELVLDVTLVHSDAECFVRRVQSNIEATVVTSPR